MKDGSTIGHGRKERVPSLRGRQRRGRCVLRSGTGVRLFDPWRHWHLDLWRVGYSAHFGSGPVLRCAVPQTGVTDVMQVAPLCLAGNVGSTQHLGHYPDALGRDRRGSGTSGRRGRVPWTPAKGPPTGTLSVPFYWRPLSSLLLRLASTRSRSSRNREIRTEKQNPPFRVSTCRV